MNIMHCKISQSYAKVKFDFTTGSMLGYCAVYQYAAYKELHRFSVEVPVKAFRKPSATAEIRHKMNCPCIRTAHFI